jgi:hypothetical protein
MAVIRLPVSVRTELDDPHVGMRLADTRVGRPYSALGDLALL